MDADLVLKADKLQARKARFKSGQLELKLDDGDLRIDKLEGMYKETRISGKLHINHGSPSRIDTDLLIQNFDLGDFLRETGMNDEVQGTIDIATHLKSRGDSVHSLMANLDGSFGTVMGEGYLTKYLDMLSVGLSNKVIDFWGKYDKAKQIKCAVVQFDIKSGVANSRAFVFNTRAGVLNGEGEINLGTEKINFLLVPTPKHPDLSFSTRLRVSGTIMDPSVSPDNVSLVGRGATALSSLAVGPLGLLAPFVHLGAPQEHACDIGSVGELDAPVPPAEQPHAKK